MDEENSKAAITVSSMIYSKLSGKVSDQRGYFMRIGISKGKTPAQEILQRVEADAAIRDLMAGDMKEHPKDWDESYMKAYMKQEVSIMEAASIASGAGGSASGGVLCSEEGSCYKIRV